MRTGCVYEAITDNINLAGAGPGESDRDQFLQISQNGITGETHFIFMREVTHWSVCHMSPNHCHSVTR